MGALCREVFLIQGEDQKSPSPDATPSPLWRTPLRARCALGWWICAADVARLVRGSPCPPLYETPAQVMLRLGEGAGTRPWGRWDPQCDWQTLGPRLSPRLGRRAPTLLSSRIDPRKEGFSEASFPRFDLFQDFSSTFGHPISPTLGLFISTLVPVSLLVQDFDFTYGHQCQVVWRSFLWNGCDIINFLLCL